MAMSHSGVGTPVPSSELEAALDGMVAKLRDFSQTLDGDEREALMTLLRSAACHSDTIQARNEGDVTKLVYEKPIQVHVTTAMKDKMRELPDLLSD